MHFQPKAAGGGSAFLQLIHPFSGACKVQAAAHLPAGGQTGFCFQLIVKSDTVLQHPRDIAFGPQLSHQAGRMPGGPAGEFALFDNDNVLPAHLRQMVGGAAPDDSTTDDYNLSTILHDSWFLSCLIYKNPCLVIITRFAVVGGIYQIPNINSTGI